MGKIVDFPKAEEELQTFHFDREKILHCIDFMSMCMQEGQRTACKCMCSKECIDETISFLNVVSEAWEEL